ncbi:hypothetical protein CU633_14065 [Bacillus sp. V3-13]|uniref:DUF6431 domain-containing protein n=1 Tax=Bacillus sp. V3-13 TaxID=2053728 RepID=UPI000C785312|nr:DUF6431 domain-containing protein [Bacillus sp. V3-13]PLR76757.1 hypothetical protein CU633_14065 [Bacillus sp. V3-13]
MPIFYDFKISISTYKERGKENDFPVIHECPDCGAKGLLHRHGFFERNVIISGTKEEVRIAICRVKCSKCKKAFSVLPDFVIPRYQHSLSSVITNLKERLEGLREEKEISRQLSAFHLKRFMRQLNWIHSFFADMGHVMGVMGDKKERAIKYLKMIRDFGESTFLQRSKGHLSTYSWQINSTIFRSGKKYRPSHKTFASPNKILESRIAIGMAGRPSEKEGGTFHE